ncbi:hypothetical protein [Prescottella sp. R16]|uniref:hypothetical protein n=1 Tax=Prescottella sp. R16 TaxID=3064529 RepID=UPI00272DD863|nr:hypothetical protein [Prescottella sp. R16]
MILDGHDRLVAALSEGVAPEFVCLTRVADASEASAESRAVADYETAMANLSSMEANATHQVSGVDEARGDAAVLLAEKLSAVEAAATRAWTLTVGEWDAIAARTCPSRQNGLGLE